MNRSFLCGAILFLGITLCSCTVMLYKAAETGDTATINKLIREGSPVDERGGPNAETALIAAARKGNLSSVRALLEAGADINAKAKSGDTALSASTAFCHPNVVNYLLEHKADVNIKNYTYGSTPLTLAVHCGDLRIVDSLIKHGANINERNNKGATALIPAVWDIKVENAGTRVEIVNALLYAGADTEVTWDGKTPLYEAAYKGSDIVARLLIEKRANVNFRSRIDGWTPLMIASAEKHASTVLILLDAGADVNLANNQGRTALMFAASYGYTDIMQLLLSKGADVNRMPDDNRRMTALMAATEKGHKEAVEILLKAGADPNIRNKEGKTALDYANKDIKALLQRAGGK